MSGRVAALGWILSRLVVLLLLLGYEAAHGVGSDVTYFARSLLSVSHHGLANTLVEYPVPAVAVLAVPMGLAAAAGSTDLYPATLLLCLLVTDAVFTTVLFQAAPVVRRRDSLVAWLLAGPLLGGVLLARLDLVVGVLAGVVVLIGLRRPAWAAVTVVVATSLKLWPVLLVPAVLAAARRRLRSAALVAAIGMALAACIVAVTGPGRLLSPLTYQSDRGLQVESVAATPGMLAWAITGRPWHVHYAASRSFEVVGPGTGALILLSTVLTLVLLVVLALSWGRALRRHPAISEEALVWLCLTAVATFIVSSKVLSPQYLLWLLPIAVVGLARVGTPSLRTWTVLLLGVCGLTHLVYPWLYRGLVRHNGLTDVALVALAVRNLGLVLLLALALRSAWRSISPDTGAEPPPTTASSSATH